MNKRIFVISLLIVTLQLTACSQENSETELAAREADMLTLQKLKESGVDFSKEQLVDFHISVDSERNAKKIQNKLTKESFICTTSDDHEGTRWTTQCSKEMLLEIDGLIKEQVKMDSIAQKYHGYLDGWGVMVKPNP